MNGRSVTLPEFSHNRRAADRVDFLHKSSKMISEDEVSLLLAKARGAARAEGFADGVAQAEHRSERELENRIASLAATIEVARSDHMALGQGVADQMHQIVSIFLAAIAPNFGRAGLIDEIAATLSNAAKTLPDAVLTVEVAPECAEQISDAMRSQAIDCKVEASPSLTNAEARVHWRNGFDAIDVNQTIARARSILATHLGAEIAVNSGSLAPMFEPTDPLQEPTDE